MIEFSRPKVFERQPVVSVLMLTYNHEPHIAEAIEGVLAQACPFPIELIVAEDCSKDKTRAIAEQFMEQNPAVIRIVTGEKNIGAMPNFYRALAQCRGKYIALCEGDDYWCDPLKLEKQIAILEADEQIGMVHGNYTVCQLFRSGWAVTKTGAHGNRAPADLRGDVFSGMLTELLARTCTVCYRKSVLDAFLKSPLADPTFLAGDLPIAVFCAASWRVEFITDIIAVYRLSAGSATRGSFSSKVRFMKSVIDIHRVIEQMYGHRSDYNAVSYSWACQTLAKAAFRAEDAHSFRLALEILERIDPAATRSAALIARRVFLEAAPLGRLVNGLIDSYSKIRVQV